MVAISQQKGLGILAIYSLGDVQVTESQLKTLANQFGVDHDYLPPSIRKVDAFRRATASVADKKHKNAVLVRELENTKDHVLRIVEKRLPVDEYGVDEVKAGRETQLQSQHIATLRYDRWADKIESTVLHPCGHALVQKAVDAYAVMSTTYDITHIRKMLQAHFERCNGITYRRNGGVAFVPESHAYNMRIMALLIYALGSESVLDIIDVVDSVNHRADIGTKVHTHVNDEVAAFAKSIGADVETISSAQGLQGIIAEMITLCKTESITATRASSMVDEFRRMTTLVKTYEELLGANMDAIQSTLELGMTTVTAMLDKVEV